MTVSRDTAHTNPDAESYLRSGIGYANCDFYWPQSVAFNYRSPAADHQIPGPATVNDTSCGVLFIDLLMLMDPVLLGAMLKLERELVAKAKTPVTALYA